MSVDVSLNIISSGFNRTKINENFTAIQNALSDAVSRSGNSPNTMTAALDMNSQNIINVGDVSASTITVNGQDIVAITGNLTPKGDWGTATEYALRDLVVESGNTYICIEAHTSGTFSTDLAADKWMLFSNSDSGSLAGPGSSTDNAIVRFDGTAGTQSQNSVVIIDDSGNITGVGTINGNDASTLLVDADLGSTVQAFDADTLKADTSDQLTVGYTTSENTYGSFSSGTLTVNLAAQRISTATNNGAFTIAPDASNTGEQVIYITNTASAGAITLSSWTVVSGSFDTTNGNKFRVFVEQSSVGDYMWIEALQ